MTAVERTARLLRRAAELRAGGPRMYGVAAMARWHARRIASAAIMAPAPTEKRTAEQALDELREAMK